MVYRVISCPCALHTLSFHILPQSSVCVDMNVTSDLMSCNVCNVSYKNGMIQFFYPTWNLLELIYIIMMHFYFFLSRLYSWPGLLLWTESSVRVCQCDERKLYRQHYGSRQRKVRLLYRPCFGNKL